MGADEKHAATYHGGEYDFGSPDVVTAKRVKYMSDSEFNLWLDKIRAEAKAEAWDEGWCVGWGNAWDSTKLTGTDLVMSDNPYKEES